jgi:hypothetical protein
MFCGFFGAACSVGADRLLAQAPPGPLPQAQPQSTPTQPPPRTQERKLEQRKTLAGFWKLNLDESDDPRKSMQDARHTNSGGPRGGGGHAGIGFPFPGAGGGPPYGGRGGGNRSGQDQENAERMQDLIRPADSLNVALKEAEVDLIDNRGHALVFYTDGRKLQKTNDGTRQEITAHWDGSRLVSDEKNPQGRKMSRTLELSADGTQFYETLRIDSGKSNSPLVIRYVYDAAVRDNS